MGRRVRADFDEVAVAMTEPVHQVSGTGRRPHPTVTFLICTFNQEKFVRCTIEAALAQDLSPIEILVSDDCSVDATWPIIQDLAGEYTGAHRLKIRREKETRGTLGHLLRAATEATGDLIILSAGDDISYPGRTREIVECWMRTDAVAFSSRHDVIDEQGNYLKRDLAGEAGAQIRAWTGLPGDFPLIKGSTSAYARSFLLSIPAPLGQVLHEDLAASLWLVASGLSCSRVEAPLVAYRRHRGAVSFRSGSARFSDIVEDLRREDIPRRQYLWLCDYLLEQQLPRFEDPEFRRRVCRRVEGNRAVCETRLRCIEATSPWSRLWLLLQARELSTRLFIARRMFGVPFTASQKFIWRLLTQRTRHWLGH